MLLVSDEKACLSEGQDGRCGHTRQSDLSGSSRVPGKAI